MAAVVCDLMAQSLKRIPGEAVGLVPHLLGGE
jgi:hypothetical protein